ncbi:hypothetical protein [Candidatus Pyrohabitans sp.]
MIVEIFVLVVGAIILFAFLIRGWNHLPDREERLELPPDYEKEILVDMSGSSDSERSSSDSSPRSSAGGTSKKLKYPKCHEKNCKVCFYVDMGNGGTSSGHSWVTLECNGFKAGYGFYPNGGNPISTQGIMMDDSTRIWHYRICYPITTKQKNAIIKTVKAWTKYTYRVLSQNCTDFIEDVAAAAGLKLPPTSDFGISRPNRFASSLKGILKSGKKTFHGGTVEKNPKNPPPK